MSKTARLLPAAAGLLAAVLLTACQPEIAGLAAPAGSGTATTTGTCKDVTNADPWIAFQSSLKSSDELVVGKRGWISGVSKKSDVEVTGDVDAIRVDEGHANTEIRCGTVVSSATWVEVTALAPGTVTLTVNGDRAATTLHLTVVGK